MFSNKFGSNSFLFGPNISFRITSSLVRISNSLQHHLLGETLREYCEYYVDTYVGIVITHCIVWFYFSVTCVGQLLLLLLSCPWSSTRWRCIIVVPRHRRRASQVMASNERIHTDVIAVDDSTKYIIGYRVPCRVHFNLNIFHLKRCF